MSIARSILPLGTAGTSPAASAATLIKTVAEANRQRAAHLGPEVSVTVSATAQASSRDEDARIVSVFHKIFQNSPLDGRPINATAEDARVLVAAWAQNAGYTSSDLTSDDFLAFVNEKAPSADSFLIPTTGEVTSPAASAPPLIFTKEEDDQIIATFHRLYHGGPENISAKDARLLVGDYATLTELSRETEQHKAAMIANGTWEGSPWAEREKRAEYTRQSTNLFSDAIGLPKGFINARSYVFACMTDQVAVENGLPQTNVAPAVQDGADTQKLAEAKQAWEKNTLEYLSVSSDGPRERTAQTKEMRIVIDRATAASAFGKTLTLVPSNAEPPFGGQLNTDQQSQLDDFRKGMSGHGIAASQVHSFDVVDETGRAVGMVLSVGWDDLAQEKGASMLENAFRILQRTTDYAV